MIESYRLSDVRRAIRRYLNALPDDEPVDLIFLASIIANFDPDRSLPHWLVIVGDPGTGKSKLVEMIRAWPMAFSMTQGISQGFFLSTRGRDKVKESALERIQREKRRILLWSDIMGLTAINRGQADAIHAQLIGVHDGYLYRESGLNGEARIYRAEDHDRLGFIAAGTPSWYTFQRNYHAVGTRFSMYHWPSKHWSSIDDLMTIGEVPQSEYGPRYKDAALAVQAYLDYVIENIDGLRAVQLTKEQQGRIYSAVKLVMRTYASADVGGDSGRRVGVRAANLARVLAFMQGQSSVSELDMQIIFRFIMSQATPQEQAVIRECLDRRSTTIERMLAKTGGTRRVYTRVMYQMCDVGILEAAPKGNPKPFTLSPSVVELAERARMAT